MNPIIQILQEHDVSQAQINDLFQTLTENPMAAMMTIQTLGIPPEKLQSLMGLVMTNPGLIKEAVDELGLDFSKVEEAKEALKNNQ